MSLLTRRVLYASPTRLSSLKRIRNTRPRLIATFVTSRTLGAPPQAVDPIQDAEITLHWLDKSRSQRIVWLLEELGLKYRLAFYKRQSSKLAPPGLKAIHPLGKAPAMEIKSVDDDGSIVLAESANIVEYITAHFGERLIPSQWRVGKEGKVGGETEEWLRYRFFMHYSEGSLMNIIAAGLLKDGIKKAPVPFFIKPITGMIGGMIEKEYLNEQYKTHLTFLEAQMQKSGSIESTSESPISDNGPFFCGPNLTSADFMMCFGLEAAQEVAGLTKDSYPLLTNYVSRIQSRQAYQKAIQRIIDDTGVYESGL